MNELSLLMLEVMDEIHLLQPQGNIQLAARNDDRFLKAALRVVRKGYGYPSVFNADGVVDQMVRQGKTLSRRARGRQQRLRRDRRLRQGGLHPHGLPQHAEDPRAGAWPRRGFASIDDVFAAFTRQLERVVAIKHRGNLAIEKLYAEHMPAVFLSVLIDDCIANGRDYNAGGARYNTSYIQCVGIGTVTDASPPSGITSSTGDVPLPGLLAALRDDLARPGAAAPADARTRRRATATTTTAPTRSCAASSTP